MSIEVLYRTEIDALLNRYYAQDPLEKIDAETLYLKVEELAGQLPEEQRTFLDGIREWAKNLAHSSLSARESF